jgi:hypothetical protein
MDEKVRGFGEVGELGDATLGRIRDGLWQALELTPVARDCWSLILSYVIFELRIGHLYDVLGGGANLNMFYAANDRWDVCRLLRITPDYFEFEAVDRVHPYGYLYVNRDERHECVIHRTQLENRVAPYLSRVKRSPPAEAREYDLVDYVADHTHNEDKSQIDVAKGQIKVQSDVVKVQSDVVKGQGDVVKGQIDVYEVAANIGSSLWILPVTRYTSQEFKDSLRLWVDVNDPRLRRYRSTPQVCLPSDPPLTLQDQLVGYKYMLHNTQKWIYLTSNTD